MKKIIIFVLIFIAFIFLTDSVMAEKEIEFWTINLSPQYDSYFLDKIKEFEKINPEIKIVWQDINFSSINQKLQNRIAAGEVPEVVNLSPQLMRSLLEEELLFPISTLEENYSKSYYPLLWQNGYYQGQYYAFPWYLSSKLMAYNQEIFKIAGVDPQKDFKSKEELFSTAEKLTAQTGVYALMPQIKIHHDFIEAGIKLFKEDNNQHKAAFNTEKAEKIIERYQQLVEKGVIPEDTLRSGFNIALERYKRNDLAILFTAPQFLKSIENESDYLKDMTALAAIPTSEAEVINASLMNLVIPEKADHIVEAASFANFITSAESQLEFSQRASVLSSAIIKKYENNVENRDIISENNELTSLENEAQFILKQQLANNQDLTLLHPEADSLIKIMDEQFARAFANKITAREALNIMEAKWNQLLVEENDNE